MIVLDTHTLVWYASGSSRLSKKSLRTINLYKTNTEICVSSITIWEIALLVRKKRLILEYDISDWIKTIESLNYFKFVPVDNKVALEAINLPGIFHKDPADRIIVATARILNAKIITADAKIRKYKHVSCLW